MSKEYKWGIQDLKIARSSDGLSNVIKKIYYRRSLKQTVNGIEHEVHHFGEFKLAPANPTNFTEYQNLTEAQLFSWLDAILPVDFINSRLDDYMVKKLEKDEIKPNNFSNNLITDENALIDSFPVNPGQIGE
jgi:hypothetical protein